MAAVTQRVPNYLGGVSRQSDDKKLPNQVRECLNGYPDPTFGLTKRPGFKWIKNLGTGTTYDNCKWFYIHRDNDEKYIGCIKPKPNSGYGDIDIWNATTGVACNVYYDAAPWVASTPYVVGDKVLNGSKVYQCDTAGTSAGSGGPTGTGSDISDNSARWDYVTSTLDAQNYLTGARTNYDVLTVQDTSILTNNLHTVTALTAPTYKTKARAALVLAGSPVGKYNVTISDIDGSNSGSISEYDSPATATYDQLLTELRTRILALNISNLTVDKYDDALHLERNSGATEFKVTASGGVTNDKLNVVQDVVDNVSQLPFNSVHNRTVKVVNTDSVFDTYWAKFVAEDGTSGRGYWAETVDPTVSTGLVSTTMPHELINTGTNTFVFRKITWTARKVGDNITNPQPSFVGAKIQQSFFHNSRLGLLSKDNVALSQTQDFYNFYAISAQTQTDSDPVDLSCSSIRPAALHGVIPTTQGLVLFSKSQQFLMGSGNGILTPSTTTIRTISNYEMDTDVDPIDMGTNINFISKTPAYTRVFGMVTRGQDENPQVLDIGKVVNEWVPATIDTFIASPQNQFLAMSSQSDNKIYFYRTHNDGKNNVMESWYNWQLMGNVQGMALDSDEMFAVTKQGGQFTLSVASLSQSPSDAIIVNNDGSRINPCMDLYTSASNAAGNNKVDYDATNKFSKCYIPWNNVSGLTPVIIIKGTTATGQFIESGFTTTPTVVTTDGSGNPLTDPYFKVEWKDLTSVEDDVVVGWKYDLDIILPKTYVRTDEGQRKTDYTATLTVARMKFAVGLSGVMGFKLKSTGSRQGKKEYIADGITTVYQWDQSDLKYIDDEQIKVKINNVVSNAYTVDSTGTLPKITLTAASSELKTLSGNGSTTTWDLTYTPNDLTKLRVKFKTGVDSDGNDIWTLQDSSTYDIVKKYIIFKTAPASGTNNILVYSADDIVIYLDEWYNLNPTQMADAYLANDIALSEQSVFTIPIHQKSDNFQLRIFNDSPFPVSLNSMMWEGNYSPRFYKRF